MTNARGDVGADHVDHGIDAEAEIAVESGNRFAAGKPFDDEDRLNQVRGGERRFRAQVAQVRRLPQAQAPTSARRSLSECSQTYVFLPGCAVEPHADPIGGAPSPARIVSRVWPGPEACHASTNRRPSIDRALEEIAAGPEKMRSRRQDHRAAACRRDTSAAHPAMPRRSCVNRTHFTDRPASTSTGGCSSSPRPSAQPLTHTPRAARRRHV